MGSLFSKHADLKRGLPAGTVVFVGEKHADSVEFEYIGYSEDELTEQSCSSVDELLSLANRDENSWLNILGIFDTSVIEKVGEAKNIHPLVLEDIANTFQRPKCEVYDHFVYLNLKMLTLEEKDGRKTIATEQVGICLFEDCVITFQERPGDVFDGIRERIRTGRGRIRKMDESYLVYTLVDAIIDNYFVILEALGERIEMIDEQLSGNMEDGILNNIRQVKKEMIFLRKSVWPVRELISSLVRQESPLVSESTVVFYRDVYDHTIQLMDTIESFRDMISGMIDLYLSNLSNRMNEVMKVLTIIATIFIPLTFIAGIYGMNFELMPELKWKYGYAMVWSVMLVVGGIMVGIFKKKRWL